MNTFELKITPFYDRSMAIAVLQNITSHYVQQMAHRLGIALSLSIFDYEFNPHFGTEWHHMLTNLGTKTACNNYQKTENHT